MPTGIYHHKSLSEETKQKMKGRIPWNKGKKTQTNSGKTHFQKGQTPWNKGKKGAINSGSFKKGHIVSKEIASKVGALLRGRFVGENSPSWKGGISKDYMRYNRTRRNRKLSAEGSHTQAEWELLKKQYGYRCPSCGKIEPKIKLTEDHIIPLSKGGSDFIENIQPLCKPCNSRKYTYIKKYEK